MNILIDYHSLHGGHGTVIIDTTKLKDIELYGDTIPVYDLRHTLETEERVTIDVNDSIVKAFFKPAYLELPCIIDKIVESYIGYE